MRTTTMRALLGAALAVLSAGPGTGRAEAETAVDLQLVLAVDASGSVDDREFALQMSGIAAAFRDRGVIAALGSGPEGRIAVTLAIWADATLPKYATPWHVVHDAASAARFAALVEGHPRRIQSGGTGIGKAVLFCVGLFEGNGFRSRRRVIDLSGDGRETAFRDWGVPPTQARVRALARGVTINGLAILTDDPELESYYRAEVVVGFDAFTLAAGSFEDFARAMRRKLIREIEYEPIVGGRPGPRPGG